MFPLLFTPASVLKLMRWSYRFFIKGEKIYPGSIFEG
jgi:hypothetical protein